MPPELLRGGFRIAFLIFVGALALLPFEPRGSAEFVVTVLAAVAGGLFVLGIALLARTSTPPMPDDKTRHKG